MSVCLLFFSRHNLELFIIYVFIIYYSCFTTLVFSVYTAAVLIVFNSVFDRSPTPVPVGAFCIPVYIPYTLTGRWILGRGLCKLWLVMDYLLCSASVFNIVLISYDRFLSVTRAVSGTPSSSHM